jgi:hypothetical protein
MCPEPAWRARVRRRTHAGRLDTDGTHTVRLHDLRHTYGSLPAASGSTW